MVEYEVVMRATVTTTTKVKADDIIAVIDTSFKDQGIHGYCRIYRKEIVSLEGKDHESKAHISLTSVGVLDEI